MYIIKYSVCSLQLKEKFLCMVYNIGSVPHTAQGLPETLMQRPPGQSNQCLSTCLYVYFGVFFVIENY